MNNPNEDRNKRLKYIMGGIAGAVFVIGAGFSVYWLSKSGRQRIVDDIKDATDDLEEVDLTLSEVEKSALDILTNMLRIYSNEDEEQAKDVAAYMNGKAWISRDMIILSYNGGEKFASIGWRSSSEMGDEFEKFWKKMGIATWRKRSKVNEMGQYKLEYLL